MALSYAQYPANGSNRGFAVPFLYINKAHVRAKVDGVPVTFTWSNDSFIQLDAAPAAGTVVEVRRTTPNDARLVDFVDGSTLTESDLDQASTQFLYLSQEAQDRADEAPRLTAQNTYDFQGRRATSLANPVAAQDAVTKAWAEADVNSSVARSRANADEAGNKAVQAGTSASQASTSASQASASATAAKTAQTAAEYAAKNPDLSAALVKAQNFADVADKATARDNLGLKGAATREVGVTGGVALYDDPRFSGTGTAPGANAVPHLFSFVQAGDVLTGPNADYGPVFQRAMNSTDRIVNASTTAVLPIRTPVMCYKRQKRLIGAVVDIFGNFDAFTMTQQFEGPQQPGADQVFFDDFVAHHYGSGHVLKWFKNSGAGGGSRIKIQANDPASPGLTGNVVSFYGSYMRFYDLNINSWRTPTTRLVTSKYGGSPQTITEGWALNIDAMDGFYNIESNVDQLNINGTGLGMVVQSSELTKRPEGVHINVPACQNQNIQMCLRSGLGISIKGGTCGVGKGATVTLDPVPTYSAPGIMEYGLEDIRIDMDWTSAEADPNSVAIQANASAPGSIVSLSIGGLICNALHGVILAPNVDVAEVNCRFAHIRGTAFQLNGAHNVRLSSTFRDVAKNATIYGPGPFIATANVFEAGKAVEIDTGNAPNYRWVGNVGVRTDGIVTAITGPSNNVSSGDMFVNIPHGLQYTPRLISLGAPQAVSGGFIGLKAQVAQADSNNITVQVYWDGKALDGQIKVSAHVSI